MHSATQLLLMLLLLGLTAVVAVVLLGLLIDPRRTLDMLRGRTPAQPPAGHEGDTESER
jgi:hypothetical protein